MARNGVLLQNSNLLSNSSTDFSQTFLSMIEDSLHFDSMISWIVFNKKKTNPEWEDWILRGVWTQKLWKILQAVTF